MTSIKSLALQRNCGSWNSCWGAGLCVYVTSGDGLSKDRLILGPGGAHLSCSHRRSTSPVPFSSKRMEMLLLRVACSSATEGFCWHS